MEQGQSTTAPPNAHETTVTGARVIVRRSGRRLFMYGELRPSRTRVQATARHFAWRLAQPARAPLALPQDLPTDHPPA